MDHLGDNITAFQHQLALIGLLLVVPFTRYPVRLATKRWVVSPYIEAKSKGFASGNVYVGGFPNDGEGGFSMGGGGGFPGGGPGDGSDGFSGGDEGGPDASGSTGGSSAADDDVVDVDFSVEEEERTGTD